MAPLVARKGAAAIFAQAGYRPAPRPRATRRASLAAALGVHSFGGKSVVGFAAPFGAFAADAFGSLVSAAREAGAEEVRLAPWRTGFLVGLPRTEAPRLAATCAALGFIVDPADLRLRVVACAGAPACSHAHAPVQEDAARWAKLMTAGDGVILHLSGCSKGCARPEPTALTIVAGEAGYSLVPNGRAGDRPSRAGLSRDDVERLIASRRYFRKRSTA
jgi:precorrin-3B synthase